MTFGSNVAPRKVPLRPKPQPWACYCPKHRKVGPSESLCFEATAVKNPGYLVACPTCGMRRPD